MRALLHMRLFVNNRKLRYQHYGPSLHVPEGLWCQKANEVPAEQFDNSEGLSASHLCASLCVHKCDSCELTFCETCHHGHTCSVIFCIYLHARACVKKKILIL